MTERFLRDAEVAAMLGTPPGVAVSLLEKAGICPVDFGRGRGRGRRWLESAVIHVMRSLHDAAQTKPKPPRPPRPKMPTAHLGDMSAREVFQMLTKGQSVQ